MKEPLDLNFAESQGYFIMPSHQLKEHSNHLLQINDLRKKLQYYNKHICSLSYFYNSEGLFSNGEYRDLSGNGQIFFKKTTNPNNDSEFEIYLEERQREIERLKNLLDEVDTYADKLKCLIESRAGQYRLDNLKVYNTDFIRFIANGGGIVPQHLLGKTYVIDLDPRSPEERRDYNLYLRTYVERLIAEPEKFQWLKEVSYRGFLASPAIKAFKLQVKRAFNPTTALASELKRVEQKFYINSINNYIEYLYPYKIENFNLWQMALFNAFLNGCEFDYSRKQLTEDEMQAIIHVEQALNYYKHLNKLKDITERRKKMEAEKLSPEQIKRKFADHFEYEFNVANIPFSDLLNKTPEFKNALLNEYLKAETKPCFSFYLNEFYSPEEYAKGIVEANNNIPASTSKGIVAASFYSDTPFERQRDEIFSEFKSHVVNYTLAANYYCPDIEKTVIVQTLRAIDNEYEILKKSIFDERTDKYKEAEIRAKNVNALSTNLGEFASSILEYLVQGTDNILLYINEADKSKIDFWQTLKSNFNRELSITRLHQPIDSISESILEAKRGKPIFKPEAVLDIFNILKDFFSVEQQENLKQILQTGNNQTEPLIFLDTGNRLADAFKQLIKSDMITGCDQLQLEKWIAQNFKYYYRNDVKTYTPKYLNDIISTNKDKCQKPLLNVNRDKATGNYYINKA